MSRRYRDSDDDRSRSRSFSPERRRRRASPSDRQASPHFSKFYRERFGDKSPDHYNNLRISNVNDKLSDSEIIDVLELAFEKYQKFEIKVIQHSDSQPRFVYVNFEKTGCAKDIRRSKIPHLQKVLGTRICLDPTGVVRDQEGKYIPDRYNRTREARERQSPPPPRRERRASPPHRSSRRSPPPRPRRGSPVIKINADDQSRTLFVGNLPGDIKYADVKDVFAKYGDIESIDVKYVSNGNAGYAFVCFRSLANAIEARLRQHDRPLRRNDSPCQIGFGKSQSSRRLWVYGLGSWTSKAVLENHFDRFGKLEDVDFVQGEKFAYVTFRELSSANDAKETMETQKIEGHEVQVDYASMTNDPRYRKRSRQDSPPSPHAKRARQLSVPRSPSSTPPSPQTREVSPEINLSAPKKIDTLKSLDESFISTWKGQMSLKKIDYNVCLYRIAGSERVLQEYLRDDDGLALKLTITQRFPMDSVILSKLLTIDLNRAVVCVCVGRGTTVSDVIEYLSSKQAVGTVSNVNWTTFVLPPCDDAEKVEEKFAPTVNMMRASSKAMLLIVKLN